MEIYLVRHTKPLVAKGICYGQTDLELADSFPEEAALVMNHLPKRFDAVYSSPLKRCRQLALKITTTPIIDENLKELNFGDWEMKAWDDIPPAEIKPWYADWIHEKASNTGESYEQLYNRCIDFLNRIHGKYPASSCIAIITHAGVIRALNAHINQLSLENSFDLKLDYGAVVKLSFNL